MARARLTLASLLLAAPALLACASVIGWDENYRRGVAALRFGHAQEAEARLLRALDMARRLEAGGGRMGGRDFVRPSHLMLTALYEERGDLDLAVEHARAAVARIEDEDLRARAEARSALRDVLVARGDLEEARGLHQALQDDLSAFLEGRTLEWGLAVSEAGYGEALTARGERAAARRQYARCVARRFASADIDGVVRVPWLRAYAALLAESGEAVAAALRHAEAEKLLAGSDYADSALLESGFQAIVARWSDERMPLRVRIEPARSAEVLPGLDAEGMVREAFAAWSEAAGTERLAVAFTDSRTADILVRWRRDPAGRALFAGRTFSQMAWDDDPVRRVQVDVVSRVAGTYLPAPWLRHVVFHEVGHALGIRGHSPLREDVMFRLLPEAREDLSAGLSGRDRATLELLYRQRPGQGLRRHATP